MFVSRKCHTIPWTSPPTPAAPLITTTDHLLKLFRNPPERQSPSLSPPITHSSSCSSSSLSPLSIIFSRSFALTSFQAQDLAVRQILPITGSFPTGLISRNLRRFFELIHLTGFVLSFWLFHLLISRVGPNGQLSGARCPPMSDVILLKHRKTYKPNMYS